MKKQRFGPYEVPLGTKAMRKSENALPATI